MFMRVSKLLLSHEKHINERVFLYLNCSSNTRSSLISALSIYMDLVEFLKKYSKVSNKFIDDFFGLYDISDKYAFSVSLDKLAQWLNMRRDNIKRILVASYIKNVDYIVEKPNVSKKKNGGHNKEEILMTSSCFKLVAMGSNTKRAGQVREYYIELENLIDDYKNYIIEGLNSKIKALENNQKPKVNPNKGVFYVLQTSDDTTLYKIGKTVNLKKRLLNYNADKSNDFRPIFIYETDDIDKIESCVKLHTKEYQYRKYKEVYQINIDILKKIVNECMKATNKINLIKKNKPLKQDGGNFFVVFDKE